MSVVSDVGQPGVVEPRQVTFRLIGHRAADQDPAIIVERQQDSAVRGDVEQRQGAGRIDHKPEVAAVLTKGIVRFHGIEDPFARDSPAVNQISRPSADQARPRALLQFFVRTATRLSARFSTDTCPTSVDPKVSSRNAMRVPSGIFAGIGSRSRFHSVCSRSGIPGRWCAVLRRSEPPPSACPTNPSRPARRHSALREASAAKRRDGERSGEAFTHDETPVHGNRDLAGFRRKDFSAGRKAQRPGQGSPRIDAQQLRLAFSRASL